MFFYAGIFAQEVKIEKEHRVAVSEVPSAAVEWLSTTFPQLKKVKWYLEESSRNETDELTQSFEAKFKRKGRLVSVEFSSLGLVEDVETDKSLHSLNLEIRKNLLESFQDIPKFKLIKLQEQWSHEDPVSLQGAILEDRIDRITTRYEIEFKAKFESEHATWEGLFDQNGQLISRRKIVLRPTDNLDL